MKRSLFTLLFLLCASSLWAGEAKLEKELTIPFLDAEPVIDGQADPCWENVPEMTDFSLPWEEGDGERTGVKMFCGKDAFYMLWTVEDSTPVYLDEKNKRDVAKADRVEIFFLDQKDLSRYYSIEMSPSGMALDYFCKYYRLFDYDWIYPNLKLAGYKYDGGYQVEAAFDYETMRQLGILKPDQTIWAGLYRADFERGENGQIIEHWITWIDPQIEKADFHIPETFGIFHLQMEP